MSPKNSKWGINFKKVNCPKCGDEQAKVRRPKNIRQFLWGGSTCPKCGTEMDKFGKEIE
jgi:ribosomal protein S27AE